MKKILVTVSVLTLATILNVNGQGLLKRVSKKAEQMVNEKLERKMTNTVDSTTDRGLRKTYDKVIDRPLDSAFEQNPSKKVKEKTKSTDQAFSQGQSSFNNFSNDERPTKFDTSFINLPDDLPDTEKEAMELLSGITWDLQWKHPIYFLFKSSGEFLNCISIDPLFCVDPMRWELNWNKKELITFSTTSAGVARVIKKLTRNEMVLWDSEYKVVLKFKPYEERH